MKQTYRDFAQSLLEDSAKIQKSLAVLNGQTLDPQTAAQVYIANALGLLVQAIVLQVVVSDEGRT